MSDHAGPETGERTYPQRDDGGPAFPRDGMITDETINAHPGMSLRDWFAGQALGGLLYTLRGIDKHIDGPAQLNKFVAGIAYELADAMIEARKK